MAASTFLVVLAFVVGALSQDPFNYTYDCRQANTGCGPTGECSAEFGTCSCEGTEDKGYDCSLDPTIVKPCEEGQICQYDAICTAGVDGCFCPAHLYGSTCIYPRLNVWCASDKMFINVYPYGNENFDGQVYVSTDGLSNEACPLDAVPETPLTAADYPYVLDVTNVEALTNMKGYYKELVFTAAEGDACGQTITNDVTGADDVTVIATTYTRNVTLEYRHNMQTGIDSTIMFTCDVNKETNSYQSDVAMQVDNIRPGENDNPLDVSTKVDPVIFLLTDPLGAVITNVLQIGDAFDIRLQRSDVAYLFKVASCKALDLLAPVTNEDGTITNANEFVFLTDGCPVTGAEQIFRSSPSFLNDAVDVYQIPLEAFRFRGDSNYVYLTCEIKLCADPDVNQECAQPACSPQDSTNGGGETENGGGTDNGGTDNGGTDNGESTPPEGGGTVRRRRRRAADVENRNVTGALQVAGSNGASNKLNGNGTTPDAEMEPEDCLQHSEVVVIIAIFSSVLVLMIVIVVVLVICLLRPRPKVVDASSAESTTADTVNRYSLPRLSLATTM